MQNTDSQCTSDPMVQAIHRKNLLISTVMIVLQIVLFVSSIMSSSGYITPFLHHPFGQVLMVAAPIAEVCAIRFAYCATSVAEAQSRWFKVQTFCMGPVFLVPLLGPALLTILQALGVIR